MKDLFAMNEKELQSYLKELKVQTKKLAEEATNEIAQYSQKFRTLSIKPLKTEVQKGDLRAALLNAIAQEQRKQAQIKTTLSKIKSGKFGLNDILNFDFISDTSNLGERKGESAHDKYARVMRELDFMAADLREVWDSTDVLKIDDVAIEKGISYAEAKYEVETRKSKGEEVPDDV